MFDDVVTPPFCVLVICGAVLRDVRVLERSDRGSWRFRQVEVDPVEQPLGLDAPRFRQLLHCCLEVPVGLPRGDQQAGTPSRDVLVRWGPHGTQQRSATSLSFGS